MSCNGNCNQGRECNCNSAEVVLNRLEKLLDTLDVVDGDRCISQLETFIREQRGAI